MGQDKACILNTDNDRTIPVVDRGDKNTLLRYVQDLKQSPEFGNTLVHYHHIPPMPPDFGPDLPLENTLSQALVHLGIDRLYSHQVKALEHVRKGSHVMVATPTASGKSLIYNVAVLEAVLKNKHTKALYVFPLKALEQDQLKNLVNGSML